MENKVKIFSLKPNEEEIRIAKQLKEKLGIKSNAQLLRTGLYRLKEIFLK